MKLKKIIINNFRKLSHNVTISVNNDLLIVGKNNTGKTSVFELFEKFFVSGSKFRFEDFNCKSISKKSINDIYTEFLAIKNSDQEKKLKQTQFKELEQRFPKITLDILIAVDPTDNLASIKDLLIEFDNNKELLLQCHYEFGNLEEAVLNFENYNNKIEKRIADKSSDKLSSLDFYEYIKRNYSNYYNIKFYSTKENATFIQNVEVSYARSLFNIGVITAQREVDDTSEQSKQNISNAIWNFYQRVMKENSEIFHEDIFKDSIGNIQESLNKDYKHIFDGLVKEVKENIFNNQTDYNIEIASEFDIEEMLKKNSKLKYIIDELLLPESYNGLGYSNMIYIFIQIITYKHRVDKDKKLFNILFIEEPESHLHPQMQSTFLNKVKNILGNDNNTYNFITTHSSYILQKADLSNIRYFLYKEDNIYVKSLCEIFNQEGYSNLEDFIKKYFKINTCDLFFADKAILVEGTVERILMPLLIEKHDVSAGTNLSKQHLSVIEVGGAYAHIFNELLNFLEIKTLIVTDIDSVTGSHNNKCKCDISSESDDSKKPSIKTSNTIIKNWFNKKEEPLFIKELAMSCLQSKEILVKKDKQKEIRRLTFQLPDFQETLWGRTFEEQLIIENNSYFEVLLKDDKYHYMIESLITAINQTNIIGVNLSELKSISKDLLRVYAFEIVQNIEKTSFALDLLVLEGWKIPSYIEEGFKWLQQ